MERTPEQLQAALEPEIEYSTCLNEKIDCMREQLKNSITIQEHEKIIVQIQRQHEAELIEIIREFINKI